MQIIRNPQKNKDENELVEQAIANDQQELRQTLEALPVWARTATEQGDEFWQRQRSSVWTRISAVENRSAVRAPILAWALIGTMMAVSGWLLERSMIVPSHEAAVDPDHELLMEVERMVQIDGPLALEPAALLAQEMVQELPGRNYPNSQRRSPAMRIRLLGGFVLLFSSLCIHAQGRQSAGGTTSRTETTTVVSERLEQEWACVYHGELGKWWQNSDIAKKLQLSDDQIGQLDQTFYDHKVKLIDFGAEMEKQDLKLQTLLDADVPNEGQVEAQVDQVLAARGHLEREYTLDESGSAQSVVTRSVAAIEVNSRAERRLWRQGFLPQSAPSRRGACDCAFATGRTALASSVPPLSGRNVLSARSDRSTAVRPEPPGRAAFLSASTTVLNCEVHQYPRGAAMKFGVIIFPGSNCDHDAYWTIQNVARQPVTFLWHESHDLENCDAVIVPGGFAYGDYLRTGAIAKFSPVMESVRKFAAAGGLVLGICNGFQILCESGLLPGALMRNVGLKYVCKPVQVRVENRKLLSPALAARAKS